jgi:hypothetical protein
VKTESPVPTSWFLINYVQKGCRSFFNITSCPEHIRQNNWKHLVCQYICISVILISYIYIILSGGLGLMEVSFIGGGNRSTWRKPLTCRKLVTTLSHNVASSTLCLSSIKKRLTMLVVIGTDCIGSCKSNYNMIMTMTAPVLSGLLIISVLLTCLLIY